MRKKPHIRLKLQTNVVRLEPYKPSGRVVEFLEGLLEEARNGKLKGFAAVTVGDNYNTGNCWTLPARMPWKKVLGEMHCQLAQFTARQDSEFREEIWSVLEQGQ